MTKKWQRLSREEKFKNPWWTYRFEKYVKPDGSEGEYHYMHTPAGSSMIVPVTSNGTLLLVNQYRYVYEKVFLEFPAGGIGENEAPEVCARREMIEEIGYDGDLEYIGKLAPMNGLTDEWTYVYMAQNLKNSDEFSQDEEEDLELVEMSIEDFEKGIADNSVDDGMTMAAWALVRSRLI